MCKQSVALCVVIQDSLETVFHSGFHAVDSGLQVLDSGFDISGTWILDKYSNHQGEFGFPGLNSGFKSHDSVFHKQKCF